jgi:hypothetical protein
MNNPNLDQPTEKQIVDADILEMISENQITDSLEISDKWREIVELLMEPAYA